MYISCRIWGDYLVDLGAVRGIMLSHVNPLLGNGHYRSNCTTAADK
jgi:hypothetical protein